MVAGAYSRFADEHLALREGTVGLRGPTFRAPAKMTEWTVEPRLPVDPAKGKAVVLLVEDSATVRMVVRKALKGFEVLEAVDSAAGLALAFEVVPDVVLLDRYLPGQDGLEVLRELVADERTRNVPVVFLTGDDDPLTLVTALDAGAHDFVRKPFLAQELVA